MMQGRSLKHVRNLVIIAAVVAGPCAGDHAEARKPSAAHLSSSLQDSVTLASPREVAPLEFCGGNLVINGSVSYAEPGCTDEALHSIKSQQTCCGNGCPAPPDISQQPGPTTSCTERPLRRARVELLINGSIQFVTATDSAGQFEFCLTNSNPSGAANFEVVVLPCADATDDGDACGSLGSGVSQPWSVTVTESSGNPYLDFSGVATGVCTGSVRWDIYERRSQQAGAHVIYDLLANETTDFLASEVNWLNDEQAEVRFPDGPSGFSSDGIVHIAENDEQDPDVILSNFGFWLLYQLNGEMLPPTPNCAGHGWTLATSPGCAWVVGWTSFIQAAIQDDPIIEDTPAPGMPAPAVIDLEPPEPLAATEEVEGAVAAALWDLIDSNVEAWDVASRPLTQIWDTAAQSPLDLCSFRQLFTMDYGSSPDLDAVFEHHEIDCCEERGLGRVQWQNGLPIQNALIEPYFVGTDDELEPLPVTPGEETFSREDGTFCLPAELTEAPLQVLEPDQEPRVRGVRARMTYTEITGNTPGLQAVRAITNYPDWDPMRPQRKVTEDGVTINYPFPVFFQPGVTGRVNDPVPGTSCSGPTCSGTADGVLSTFLTLDSGATAIEVSALAQQTPVSSVDLDRWVAAKRGDAVNTPIPAFLYFGIPSGPAPLTNIPCSVSSPSDNVPWGYINCRVTTAGYVDTNAQLISAHLATRVIPEIRQYTPDDVVPLNIAAHSMGGVITRHWIRRVNTAFPVARYVTFDSPHGGEAIADPLPDWIPFGFWSEHYMNGTSSVPNQRPAFADRGWNYHNILRRKGSQYMLSSPLDWVISPEGDFGHNGSAHGVGRIMDPSSIWQSNGYCERFMGGWQIPVAGLCTSPAPGYSCFSDIFCDLQASGSECENPGHGLQNISRAIASAGRFLASGGRPVLTDDTGLGSAIDFSTFETTLGDQCLEESAASFGAATENGLVVLEMISDAGMQADKPLHFDAAETVLVAGLITRGDAAIVVLDETGTEIPKSNELTSPFGSEGYNFAFEIAATPEEGSLRLMAGVEAAAAFVTATFSPTFRASTSSAALHHEPNDVVAIRGEVLDTGNNTVVGVGAVGAVTVTKADGTSVELPAFDDGLHGDGSAGDGVLGAQFTETTEPGRYSFQTTLTVSLDNGTSVMRTAEGTFFVDSTAGSFTSVLDERLVDDDGNGAWDAIEIDVGVDAVENGEYQIVADLLDSGVSLEAVS